MTTDASQTAPHPDRGRIKPSLLTHEVIIPQGQPSVTVMLDFQARAVEVDAYQTWVEFADWQHPIPPNTVGAVWVPVRRQSIFLVNTLLPSYVPQVTATGGFARLRFYEEERAPSGGTALPSTGGSGATDVAVHDNTTPAQHLAVDGAGRIGVNNFPAFPGTQAVTSTDGALNTIGAQADAAWAAGSGTVVALLKAAVNAIKGTLAAVVDSRGAANWLTSQVSIPTTAGGAQLLAARATRQSALIENTDAANPIYISNNATPTTANGIKLVAGASMTFNHQLAMYAIATGGAVATHISEEWT